MLAFALETFKQLIYIVCIYVRLFLRIFIHTCGVSLILLVAYCWIYMILDFHYNLLTLYMCEYLTGRL